MRSEERRERLATRLVLFSVLSVGIGQSMTFALLAPLGREAGLSEVRIGVIITCSSLAFTLASPLWGRTCDRWGRRPVLLIGQFGYAAGCALFATVFLFGQRGLLLGLPLFLLAILSRVLMALLMSAAPSAASAYMADTTSAGARVAGMGRLGSARTLGAILGPALVALPFAGSLPWLVVCLGLHGLALGLISPGFTAGASLAVGAREQGAVGGLVSACPAAGFVLGPILGASLYQWHPHLPYFCAALLILPLLVYSRRVTHAAPAP